jgi:hypothetical protein
MMQPAPTIIQEQIGQNLAPLFRYALQGIPGPVFSTNKRYEKMKWCSRTGVYRTKRLKTQS